MTMRFQFPTALCACLMLCPTAAIAGDPPEWWEDYDVTNGAAANNLGPVNLGQLKWMARCAWYEMNEKLPGGAGFTLESVVPEVPASPDAAWYEAQKTVVNLGQLKNVAHPFYERLLLLAPSWVANQYEENGLEDWPYPMPWDPATPKEQNLAPANIGQLKLVFSLRFGESHDGDAIPDLWEHVFYGTAAGDGTTSDYDGDGKTDAQEIADHTKIDDPDTDGDGIPDGSDSNPLVVDRVDFSASTLMVTTPLR